MSGRTKNPLDALPLYPKWVVERLVGIIGNDPGEVVCRIVVRWIDDNEEYLKKRGIDLCRGFPKV